MGLYQSEQSCRSLKWPRRSTARHWLICMMTNRRLPIGKPASSSGFAWLRMTAPRHGNWLYCGSWPDAGSNTQRRDPADPSGLGIHPEWGWSWPANRRVLYNRASCNLTASPGTPAASRSGSMKPRANGPAMTCLTSRLTQPQRPHGPLHHEA